MTSKAASRLQRLLSTFTSPSSTAATNPAETPELIGHLRFGDLSLPVHATDDPSRLPRGKLLDWEDETVVEHLYWLAQKVQLGQDIFLYGPPGPFARRLALTYCSLVNRPYEIVTLHRDVGESELKQGRELRAGGKLEYVDGPAVRAAKRGSILILEGIERAERGVLPILNNLLENREMNLEDGTHIVSADRYDLMIQNKEDTTGFVAAHRDFRVIAIGTPVPPYPGFPLDPPFRSRFQARYLDPLSTSKILAKQVPLPSAESNELLSNTADAMTEVQLTKEMRTKLASGVTSPEDLPLFPQTALLKLAKFLEIFPPPSAALSSPAQFAHTLLAIHPALSYATPAVWRSLEAALEGSGLAQLATGISEVDVTAVSGAGEGLWGWQLIKIERSGPRTASVTFARGGVEKVTVEVAAGPKQFAPYPLSSKPDFLLTPRFEHMLCVLLQLHALKDWDISILPPSASLQSSSSSTTVLINTFASLLGYQLETIHLVKDLGGGRELWMRRVVESGFGEQGKDGQTGWEPAPLTRGAWEGKLVHLEGIDALGATAGSLARLTLDREGELWEGKRLVASLQDGEEANELISTAHPSFRIIATYSKSTPPREWLSEELSGMMVSLPTIAMPLAEETEILRATGCPPEIVDVLEVFARRYRQANGGPASKSRRLGTASLLRMARRLAKFPKESLYSLINRTLLSAFLPTTTRSELEDLFKETDIQPSPLWWNPPAEKRGSSLTFPAASDPSKSTEDYIVPLYDMSLDPTGASHVPFMTTYLDNSQQTALMRDIATDLVVLGEHVLLLGNQGVGKNKIVDRLLQLLGRPREFIQLHRDSTPQSLMFQTSLEAGVIRFVDSPLLRAIKFGRVIVIDETDKAAAHVVAALASLASRGEMTLPDGRRVVPASEGDTSDIVVHPNFRMILLANRPGFPFLGNAFLRVLGDNFSPYAVSNPDPDSEIRVLSQLAPDLDPQLLKRLVLAFADLRKAFEAGTLSYPFSLRELLAIVRHLKQFPEDPLESVLRNVFDFDVHKTETIEALYDILRQHKLKVERIGIDATRPGAEPTTKPKIIEFTPKGDTSLSEPPKFGKQDDKAHVGGNTWAGGTGGRSTAGLGGRGGYMRLYKPKFDIHQIPDSLKADVPEDVKNRAREMARKELAARLAEIDLTSGQANAYSGFHKSVLTHVNQLVTFLDNLEANEEERVWLKRQSDGDLDESRLTEGLTGESSIYKRRGMEKPELGRPQLKPKRIKFIFDLSASMYRNQYDGRLTRSLEAAVMILESFARLSRKEKYRIDLVGQSGEESVISLVPLDKLPDNAGDRYKIIQKMSIIPQYCWAGDNTIEAIQKGVADVADSDSDDWFVIAITDANFARYGIEAEDLKRVMNSNSKVKCALIAIGEGAEAEWLPKALPGRAYRVLNTVDLATTFRAILGQMLGGGL